MSLNLYTYCGNNPVMYYDPSGHTPVEIGIGYGLKILFEAAVTVFITKQAVDVYNDMQIEEQEYTPETMPIDEQEYTPETIPIEDDYWGMGLPGTSTNENSLEDSILEGGSIEVSDYWENIYINEGTGESVDDLAGDIKDWVGEGRIITNDSGDKIFISNDGTRRVRFDINNTSPHNNPHGHVEELVDGDWVKSGPLYPTDVPQN